MHFDLAHFPDFQEGFYSGSLKQDTLEMLRDIRQQLGCRYVTHIGYSDLAGPQRSQDAEISVLTTLPIHWVVRYSAKNYYRVDPLVQGIMQARRTPDATGAVRNLAEDKTLPTESKKFLRDCQLRGLGNLFLAVSTSNSHGFRGVTGFTFDAQSAEQFNFIGNVGKRLAGVSAKLHSSLHSNRNPALVASVAHLLTKREIDCLYWAANGKTDGEIGEILNIARWTVVTYLTNAKNKLGCSNRTSTVATALALGMIEMPAISNKF
ncbi:MAG: LuxR C-terminal-related transcriptional regulator [Phyllobacterium sp.]|uniref:LuxR C-terminal-related transcriptional regulator n=1 Tax=Phyllobacterium sp. TaxID=1871046 RepID=UPI0030F22530